MIYILFNIFLFILNTQQESNFLFGEVKTKSGVFNGQITWTQNKNLLTDLLIVNKTDNKYEKYLTKSEIKDATKSKILKFFGFSFNNNLKLVQHQFSIQFGFIKKIKKIKGNKFEIFLKNDDVINISMKNDVFDKILVLSKDNIKKKISLNKVLEVTFKVSSYNYRNSKPLYGTVYSQKEQFTGLIKWDMDEQTTEDLIDGVNRDEENIVLRFGDIKKIQKINRYSSKIQTIDGEEIYLSGGNDVNHKNQGIQVYNDRLGYVTISWKNFKSVVFNNDENPNNYAKSFKRNDLISGSIFTLNDDVYSGNIVFDVDEHYESEMIDGYFNSNLYQIMFKNIRKIVPKNRYSTVIILKNNDKILLEDTQDVNEENDGVLVFKKANQYKYIDWKEIKSIILN